MASTPQNPVSSLLEKQVQKWSNDSRIGGAVILLIGGDQQDDVDLTQVGANPDFTSQELASLLSQAHQGSDICWTTNTGGGGARVYPLRFQDQLQGLWIIHGGSEEPPPDEWSEEATRFCDELYGLRSSPATDPPSLQQLVDSIPAVASKRPEQMSPLHWERSQARVEVAVGDDLQSCLLCDQLPIF